MSEHAAEADEWGLEFEGEFVPLDSDVPMSRESAEKALVQALEYGADPGTTFIAIRTVNAWRRISTPSEVTSG